MDIFLVIIALVFCVWLIHTLYKKRTTVTMTAELPGSSKELLRAHVLFYAELTEERKKFFEQRVQHFLSSIRITGVNTTVEEIDNILIAASAIIPIFGFPDWEYINLHEVLIYPDSFDESFRQEGTNRNTLGVVGTGAYQNIMILSKQELRNDFMNKSGKDNTAIHEFVHLIDKTDGAVDGVPEFLLSKKYVMPWLNLMQKEIKDIVTGRSDINPYGGTDPAEFFAVVSEYFFERPDLLEEKHPELYMLLLKIFKRPTE